MVVIFLLIGIIVNVVCYELEVVVVLWVGCDDKVNWLLWLLLFELYLFFCFEVFCDCKCVNL